MKTAGELIVSIPAGSCRSRWMMLAGISDSAAACKLARWSVRDACQNAEAANATAIRPRATKIACQRFCSRILIRFKARWSPGATSSGRPSNPSPEKYRADYNRNFRRVKPQQRAALRSLWQVGQRELTVPCAARVMTFTCLTGNFLANGAEGGTRTPTVLQPPAPQDATPRLNG